MVLGFELRPETLPCSFPRLPTLGLGLPVASLYSLHWNKPHMALIQTPAHLHLQSRNGSVWWVTRIFQTCGLRWAGAPVYHLLCLLKQRKLAYLGNLHSPLPHVPLILGTT